MNRLHILLLGEGMHLLVSYAFAAPWLCSTRRHANYDVKWLKFAVCLCLLTQAESSLSRQTSERRAQAEVCAAAAVAREHASTSAGQPASDSDQTVQVGVRPPPLRMAEVCGPPVPRSILHPSSTASHSMRRVVFVPQPISDFKPFPCAMKILSRWRCSLPLLLQRIPFAVTLMLWLPCKWKQPCFSSKQFAVISSNMA